MSKEMWEFDISGDLYFEKTVNGFFVELFEKWREVKCSHSVTIIYFSRIFYDKSMLKSISDERRNCLGCDYKGRMYEDIYRVITRDERREDWSPIIVMLKKHFIQYPESLRKEGFPEDCLSSASEGNFLEVLNMGANVFEKAHIDRSLEVTGQQMVVITPGAGMFEVDRELATLTKLRIVDNGMSADLVCMAEQPLHSVPLLKFHGKFGSSMLIGDDYGIPHWINHSFYTSKSQKNQSGFIPRIKVPDVILQYQGGRKNENPRTFSSEIHPEHVEENKLPDFVDYEAYDAEVFTCAQTKPRPQTLVPGYNPYTPNREIKRDNRGIEKFLKNEKLIEFGDVIRENNSIPVKRKSTTDYGSSARSLGVVESRGFTVSSGGQDDVDGFCESVPSYSPPLTSNRAVVGSADTSYFYQNVGRPQRSLVNPFRPNYLPCKMTCNRHRWRHTFPKGPGGEMYQEHHHRVSNRVAGHVDDDTLVMSLDTGHEIEQDLSGLAPDNFDVDLDEIDAHDLSTENDITPLTSRQSRCTTVGSGSFRHTGINIHGLGWVKKLHAPSEEDWTAAMKTSVDWKSLTIPACLPVTTDYNPDQRVLDIHYKVNTYELYLDVDYDVSNKDNVDDVDQVVLKPDDKLKEFISQRIGQGFQLMCSHIPQAQERPIFFSPVNQTRSGVIPQGTPDKEYFFMMGRNFHKLIYTVSSEQVSFTRYHPTHVINVHRVSYPYRLWSQCTQQYVGVNALFIHDDMTNYNWNYMDQHIVRDQDCLNLIDSLRYWRIRLALLPVQKPSNERSVSSDAEEKENELQFKYLQGILRFLETVNQIRRPPVKVKASKTPTKSRRPSTPAMMKSPAAVRTHRRSKSGEGSRDLETLNENNVATLDHTSSLPVHGVNNVPARRRSSSSDNEDILNSMPSLNDIVNEMKAKEIGLNFLPEMRGLPRRSFLGTDATSWIIHHIHPVKSRNEAVELGQKMLDEGFIQHASGSILQPFVDGFYLYFIVRTADRKPVKRPDKKSDGIAYKAWLKQQEILLFQFQAKWFEVVLKERGSEISNSPVGVFEQNEREGRGSRRIPPYRDAEINLKKTQERHTSDRPEWCTVRYHGVFCPDNAYVVQLRWLISTGAIINQLVQSWARKVTLYGFHLVPLPTFQLDEPARCDPFINTHFIPLDVAWLREHVSFKGILDDEFRIRVHLFQEAILQRFGFLKDFPYNEGIYSHFQEETIRELCVYRYIHYTGALFMTILNDADNSHLYGYKWILNDTLTKRWKSSVTLDQDAIRKLVKDVRGFCENAEGKLEKYVESFIMKSPGSSGVTGSEKPGNYVFERVLETCSDDKF